MLVSVLHRHMLCPPAQGQCTSRPAKQRRAKRLCAIVHRLAAEHEDPVALQEALLEEEKGRGPFAWIASKIPIALHNNKIWRTIFWVSRPAAGIAWALLLSRHARGIGAGASAMIKHVCPQLSSRECA